MRKELVAKCCECGSVRSEAGWRQEVESWRRPTDYTHTYCPVCLDVALRSIDEMDEVALEAAG